jgi:hypothetical protein
VSTKRTKDTKLIDGGMRGLSSEQRAKQPRRVRHVAPHRVGGGVAGSDTEGGSLTGTERSASPVDSLGSAGEEEHGAPDGDDIAVPAAPLVGDRAAPVWNYAHGQILLNRSGKSIDARCSICNASVDRSWARRPNAKQLHTKAQGRMLGAHLHWLELECDGDVTTHLRKYCLEYLPLERRKLLRRAANDDPSMALLFDREGPLHDSDSDGEPRGVPENRRLLC